MFLCGAGCRRRLKIAWLTEPGLAGIVAAVKEGRVKREELPSVSRIRRCRNLRVRLERAQEELRTLTVQRELGCPTLDN